MAVEHLLEVRYMPARIRRVPVEKNVPVYILCVCVESLVLHVVVFVLKLVLSFPILYWVVACILFSLTGSNAPTPAFHHFITPLHLGGIFDHGGL